MTDVLVVLCTCPDPEAAEQLASSILEEHLAACVNILPEIRSMYRWEGEIQTDREALMIVKTSRAVYPRLEAWLERHHPYDVPEVLATPVEAGSINYLEWVLNETKSSHLV